jgi:outer membrane lipoprotein LolB
LSAAVRRGRGCGTSRLRAPLLALALAAAVVAAGCATAPKPVAQAEAAQPGAVREWLGRFSVTLQPLDPNSPAENTGGRFELVATGNALDLTLFSPFGQTLASAARQADGSATLQMADGRRLRAETLDSLLHRALGYPLPVERLPDWLDRRFERVLGRDDAGNVIDALDSGWRIRLDARRWQLQREQPGALLTVLLVLDR